MVEVWRFKQGAFSIFRLVDGAHVEVDASQVLPENDLVELARYIVRADQHQALSDYCDAVRG